MSPLEEAEAPQLSNGRIVEWQNGRINFIHKEMAPNRHRSLSQDHPSIDAAKIVLAKKSNLLEDTKNDKSNIYGLNAVKGSWVVKMKIYNDDVYEGVKLGKFNGFSIEGLFDGLDQLKMSEEDNREELIDLIKDLINEFKL